MTTPSSGQASQEICPEDPYEFLRLLSWFANMGSLIVRKNKENVEKIKQEIFEEIKQEIVEEINQLLPFRPFMEACHKKAELKKDFDHIVDSDDAKLLDETSSECEALRRLCKTFGESLFRTFERISFPVAKTEPDIQGRIDRSAKRLLDEITQGDSKVQNTPKSFAALLGRLMDASDALMDWPKDFVLGDLGED
jgi:hypothetical protein